jgi:hypothetical protein
MRTLSLCIVSISCGLALAQAPSDVFEKAPPAIDDALRTRVDAFFQAHVDGKFRQADQYVAEDSKDAFFAADKPHYKGCQISKISYLDDFTKANVVTACKTEMYFQGQRFPTTMPNVTHWKIDNGQWFWYYVQLTERESPFGTMKPGAENPDAGVAAMIPKDFRAAAKEILSKVTMDSTEIGIDQDRSSKQELHLKNGMIGSIKVSADPTGVPGLTVRPAKSEVGPGEEIAVVVEFNFDDPAVLCRECLVHPGVRPPATVNVHVDPTQQDFPIKITFTHAQ